jgi:hypothetical protein
MKLAARLNPQDSTEIWLTLDGRKPTRGNHDFRLKAERSRAEEVSDPFNRGDEVPEQRAKITRAINTAVSWINTCSE